MNFFNWKHKEVYSPEPDQVKALRIIPVERWAAIYCTLNSWDWPEELNHIKPDWYEGGDTDRKHDFIWPIMEVITNFLGEKRLLWEHNKKSMTQLEFEEWYAHRGDWAWLEKYYNAKRQT